MFERANVNSDANGRKQAAAIILSHVELSFLRSAREKRSMLLLFDLKRDMVSMI